MKKIKRIGGLSSNGFVTEIPYHKSGYNAYAILKSSQQTYSDNLYYEALVGIFVNKLNKRYPCFLETYSPYIYENRGIYDKLKNKKPVSSLKNIQKMVKKYDYDDMFTHINIAKSCKKSVYMCVLIQHLKNSKSLEQYMATLKTDEDFFSVHLVNYLYQVYCPLDSLKDEFTHYDLHPDNVLIYHPSTDPKKYVKMVYHYPNNSIVEFNTQGISKIIDYGRCFFEDREENTSSLKFYDTVCLTKPECDPNCGVDQGYSTLAKEYIPGNFYYISSQAKNKSHDLRLLNSIWNIPGKYNGKYSDLRNYVLGLVKYEEKYGTREINKSTYHTTKEIQTVEDAHLALKEIILKSSYFKRENDRIFKHKIKMGELHVWVDGSKNVEWRLS